MMKPNATFQFPVPDTTAQRTPLTPEMLAQLRGISILSSLTDDDLSCLEDVEQVHLETGKMLVRQGEPAHYFHLLLSGSLHGFQTTPDGRQMPMVTLTEGTTFGEVPLLANMPNAMSVQADVPSHLVRLNEEEFWQLMTSCPEVRKAILGNMAARFQYYQGLVLQQEKMAALGTLAAGLMHELNNPGAAARRAAAQLRENIQTLQQLSAKFSRSAMTQDQRECLLELQEQAMKANVPLRMNSLEQSDAEEKLTEWMESSEIAEAWKLAPTLVSIGMNPEQLECARCEFQGAEFSDALGWLAALVSSQQLVGMIEESVGRVTDLVHAVKTYAYEGKGSRQTVNVNDSVHATLVMLAHKIRQKQFVLDKSFGKEMPLLESQSTGLNQVWTNLIDNAIDAVSEGGAIRIKTWAQPRNGHTYLCVSVADNGAGIPLESQPHIFDPFYTTKDVGVGTGLGLGIVNRIVEQFGGVIRFSSVPGATEFLVCIPSSAGGDQAAAAGNPV